MIEVWSIQAKTQAVSPPLLPAEHEGVGGTLTPHCLLIHSPPVLQQPIQASSMRLFQEDGPSPAFLLVCWSMLTEEHA